ncbi:hypothetical protein D1P53_000752 [Cryptococcus gattii VGV]|nr:hypothetical protein D1P53_000752 [Cryptococcus gattii VGV]
MSSPSGSPRSSVSSATTNVCGAPLTPVYELDGAAGEMVVRDSSTVDDSESEPDILHEHIAVEQAPKRINLSLAVPPPTFNAFTFPTQITAANVPLSEEGIALPREGFSFGTCPSVPFLGTPVAEQGPFEYPDMTGSRSTSRPSSIKGSSQSRSNSRSPHFHPRPLSISSQQSLGSQPDIPSPPGTRRESTVSDIATIPVAGRRPSIVHSATVETSVPNSTSASSSNISPTPSVTHLPSPAPLSHHGSIRRPSTLSFQQKALPAPIPPSLLARRGSLPAAQLFGLPLSELSTTHRSRPSANSIPPLPQSPALTAASLYQRRQSIATETGGVVHPRGTLPEKVRTSSISAGSDSTGYTSSDRRGSLPSIHPAHSLSSSRNAVLSRSGSTSSQTSRRSFTSSSRTPPTNHSSTIPSSPQNQPASLLPPLSVPLSPPFIRSSSADAVPEQTRSHHHHSRKSQSRSSSDEDDELPTPAVDSLSISRSVVGGAGMNPDVERRGWYNPTAMRDERICKKPLLPSSWPVQVIAPTPAIETPGLETVFERPPLENAESGADGGKRLTVCGNDWMGQLSRSHYLQQDSYEKCVTKAVEK